MAVKNYFAPNKNVKSHSELKSFPFQDCLSSLFDDPLHISWTNVGKYNQKRPVPGSK